MARPVISPRVPFAMVRPWTSLPAMEHRARKTESAARRARTRTPRSGPSKSMALSAMRAAEIAWPQEPMSQARLRCACAVTQGVSAACGSIEPDSRIGTSSEVKAAGTPAAVKSQGRTVLAATI